MGSFVGGAFDGLHPIFGFFPAYRGDPKPARGTIKTCVGTTWNSYFLTTAKIPLASRFVPICRGADGRVLPRPGDAIPPAGCFTRRSLPPIYIRGTRPPPTADETDTESEQEDRADTESDHSIRPVTEREQEDRDEIESDQFIQASPHDSGWSIG